MAGIANQYVRRSRPILTLLWSQWVRVWGLLLVTLPLTWGIAKVIVLAEARLDMHEDYAEIGAYALLMVAIATNLIALLLIHADADRLSVALPIRIIRLPAASWRVTFGLMSFGIVCVAVLAIGVGAIVRAVNGLDFTWWYPAVFAVCAMAALQAWSYSLRTASAWVAAATLVVVAAPLLWLLTRDATYAWFRDIHPAVAFAIAIPGMYLLTLGALMLNRRGGLPALLPQSWIRPSTRKFSAVNQRPFSSAYRSQLWYEWRQFGWLLPALLFASLALYFLGMPLAISLFGSTGINQDWSGDKPPASLAVDYFKHTQFVTSGLVFASVAASVLVGALMFVRAGYWNARSTYLMTLPMSTRRLAQARLSMAFKSAIVGTLILCGILALSSLAMKASGEKNRLVHYLGQGYRDTNVTSLPTERARAAEWFNREMGASPAEIIGFYVGALFLTMWVALWAVNAGWSLLTYAVVVGLPVAILWLLDSFGVYDGGGGEERLQQVVWWAASCALVVTLIAIAILTVAKRQVGFGVVLFALAFLAVYGYAFMRFEDSYIEKPGANLIGGQRWPHPVNWAMWVGLAALPIAPFFAHPYLVGRARNR